MTEEEKQELEQTLADRVTERILPEVETMLEKARAEGRAEARREAAKKIRGIAIRNVNGSMIVNMEAALSILAEEPKEREAEWHTDLPAKDGLYLVEVSAEFSSPSPWYETAFYRHRDGWTLPKTSEGEEVLAWMEIPRRAEVERKLKEAER